MPPQVRVGEGSKPIIQTSSEGVQEANSTSVEKQSAQQKETVKHETPHAASPKEAAQKKMEVANVGDYQRQKLNDMVIKGTKGDDNIHISKAPGLLGMIGTYQVDVNGQVQYATKQQLENTRIEAGAGNDKIIVDKDVTAGVNINGGRGNDWIVGGNGDDRVTGGAGNDMIIGRRGKDDIKND